MPASRHIKREIKINLYFFDFVLILYTLKPFYTRDTERKVVSVHIHVSKQYGPK